MAKKGKARSKQFGKVDTPEAFIGVLKSIKRHNEKKLFIFPMKVFLQEENFFVIILILNQIQRFK